MRTAVIGIGSNSVRMRLVDVENGRGKLVRREREGTRLFAGLDGEGNLSAASMATTLAAVQRMADGARRDGAEEVFLFATSATRDAKNGAEFAALLQETAQVKLEICSGEEEAVLSFLGATDGGNCGVIDIGGGSTEIVVGRDENIYCAFSCQMGAVRLQRQIPVTSHEDVPLVEAAADAILMEQLAKHPTLTLPEKWIGTGGTFTTMAALVKDVRWTECVHHGTVLTLEAVEHQARRLADMTLEERLQLHSLQPKRADIIVHGISILSAVMKRLKIDSLRVSEYGNTEGYIKRKYGLHEDIRP